jgi:predicted CopG family antitoxin
VSKSIRVEDDTHAALAALKRDDETFDELLSRLVAERRESVRDGAGLWADSDAPEKAKAKRAEMKDDVGVR